MFKASNKNLSEILSHNPVRWSDVKAIVKTHKVLDSLYAQALKKASLDVSISPTCIKLLLEKANVDENKLKHHFLLSVRCNNIRALSAIIYYDPSVLFLTDHQSNDTMLHLLCKRHGWNETIEFVMKETLENLNPNNKYHGGIFQANLYGETPLQLACQAGCDFRQIVQHVESDYPVYFAENLISFFKTVAEFCDDSDKLQKFVDNHKHDMEYSNEDGNTPLHYACYFQNSEMIHILLKTYIEKNSNTTTVMEKLLYLKNHDTFMTPFGLLLRGLEDRDDSNAWECINICMNFFSDLPILHMTIDQLWNSYAFHRKGVQILKRLTDRLGLDMTKVDCNGNSVLHILIFKLSGRTSHEFQSHGKILDYILETKALATKTDSQQRLPIHVACELGLRFEYLLKIIHACPATLEEIHAPSGLLPFALAASYPHSCQLDIIYDLIRHNPSIV
jgi:ankyrin repeat protein